MAAGDISGGTPVTPAAPAALYRKYRPATFAELKGQEHISEPLRQALRSGRVHHAYLFSGPRGCGKTSSARILARSLNCEQGPTPDPCGKCASCVALAPSGPGSIDVIEIDAASHGGVDDARDLRERAFYAPVSGRFKIYIVDEAHMVTREGFNALLKLVEEPPPHLKFVFATTEPDKVIPTIRSRTHHYAFRLMPPAILRALLEEILGAEGIRYEPEVLPVIVRAGAGSARDALSVLDQLLAGSGDEGLTYDRAVALLGYTDDRLLDEVTEAFATDDGAAVFGAVNRVVEAGHDPRRFAADLLDRLRDLIILDAVPDAGQTGLLDVPADRLERMRDQAAGFGQAKLARAAETINAGLVEMRGAASPRLQLELMCAQVLLPASPPGDAGTQVAAGTGGTADVKPLLARIERLERLLDSGRPASTPGAGQPAAVPPPAAPAEDRSSGGHAGAGSAGGGGAAAERASGGRAEAEPVSGGRAGAQRASGGHDGVDRPEGDVREAGGAEPSADALREQWPEILEAVKRERRVAWLLLSNAAVDALQDGILTLRFTREGEARGFAGSGYEEDLRAVLAARCGISPRIRAVSTAAEGGQVGGGRNVGMAGGGIAGGGVGGGARSEAGRAAGGEGPDADQAGTGGGVASAGRPGADGGLAGGGEAGGGVASPDGGVAHPSQGGSGRTGASGGGSGGPAGASGGRTGGPGAVSGGSTGEPAAGRAAAGQADAGPTAAGGAGAGGTRSGRARTGGSARGAGTRRDARGGGPGPRGGWEPPDEPASDDADGETLAGVHLIRRELGGQVIAELDGG